MVTPARVIRKLRQVIREPFRRAKARRLGISSYPPNYVYFERFDESSTVIDVGCGYEAEFSQHMIGQHRVRAIAVDPTRKHRPQLAALERRFGSKFVHLPVAVTAENGRLVFHESKQNESGSVLSDHANVQRDEIVEYEVESINLRELVGRAGAGRIALLKLDLEGAEYGLFDKVSADDLAPFDQVFLECHHHCTHHTVADTRAMVERIAKTGFQVFSLDDHNFLFYR